MVLMDVYEAERVVRKGTTEETTRPRLGLSEKNNAVIRRPRTTRDVPSRNKSAISSSHSVTTPVVPKRFSSPNVARTTPAPSLANSKRSLSAERKRPSTPPSPPRPSTPAQDVPAQMHSDPRRVPGGRSEGLWPSSTMRSLCVSFQSDTFSVPVSKKEKPVTYASYDHTLRPSANVAHRKAETAVLQRNPTPERKRSPLRGRNASDQSENSKPTDNSHPRVVDQNRSSKIMGGKVSSSAINRTMVLTDKASKASSLPLLRRGVSPARRLALSNGIPSNLQKAQSDLARRVSLDTRGVEHDLFVIDDVSSQSCGTDKLLSSSISSSSDLSECTLSTPHTVRSQSLPIPGSSRPASPCKARFPSSSPSRGIISPSRSRPSSQYPSVSSLGNRSSSTSSVLSFIADYRKGKKGANHIEDAHQLRLLYNRYQQWRFANARADAAFSIQKTTTETTLYNVWNTTSDLQYSVTIKRINLRQLREELKLQSVLDRQIAYLDDWDLLEGEQSSSLSEAMKALEACTLRLPITSGARADTHTLKNAIFSAVDVMQAMVSSMDHLLPKVEGTKFLLSELADVTRQERAMLDEYVDLLASSAAMQIEENSLRAHLIQLKQIAGHQYLQLNHQPDTLCAQPKTSHDLSSLA